MCMITSICRQLTPLISLHPVQAGQSVIQGKKLFHPRAGRSVVPAVCFGWAGLPKSRFQADLIAKNCRMSGKNEYSNLLRGPTKIKAKNSFYSHRRRLARLWYCIHVDIDAVRDIAPLLWQTVQMQRYGLEAIEVISLLLPLPKDQPRASQT